MSRIDALSPGDITGIGIGVILALIVVGFLVGLVITAIVARLIIAVVVVVLALVVWHQRGKVQDDLTSKACHLGTTFFGIHVDPPESVKQDCAQRT